MSDWTADADSLACYALLHFAPVLCSILIKMNIFYVQIYCFMYCHDQSLYIVELTSQSLPCAALL